MLAISYKNFAANPGVSHIGLGVSALNTAKVLRRHGVDVRVWPINSIADLIRFIESDSSVTHVVISAAWVKIEDLGRVLARYPRIAFSVNIHSNVGFLQADPNGVHLLREYLNLEKEMLNFRVTGNSEKFVTWMNEVYSSAGVFLPNLYFLDRTSKQNKQLYNGGTLRIGAFGATRPLKNLMTAAGAAMAIGTELRADVQFYISGSRPDGGSSVVRAVQAMIGKQPGIELIQLPWQPWPEFRAYVRRMHLLLQVSYTESFNMVTADGIAEGVPSVVSDAIDWAPPSWVAGMDEPLEVALIGRRLITDPHSTVEGLDALERHNRDGFRAWLDLLDEAPQRYMSGVFAGV